MAKLFNDNNVSYDNLPNGWAVATLGTYCDVKSGYAFKSDWWQEDGVKVIKIANIKDLTISFNEFLAILDLNETKLKELPIPQVVESQHKQRNHIEEAHVSVNLGEILRQCGIAQ